MELTASEFLRSVVISESASIHGESLPTIRVFQSGGDVQKNGESERSVSMHARQISPLIAHPVALREPMERQRGQETHK